MVRLQVSARVVPEDSYLAHVDGPKPATFPGEKKLRVTVGRPEEWQIGRLANEVADSYLRTYRRELGNVKYLKDDADDCDLDPTQLVYNLLFDEGRASTDQRDQHVTIKVIQEQGRDIRAGSVVPDLRRPEYQTRRLPPTFASAESSLGKHPRVSGNEQDLMHKRPRLPEIDETRESVGLHTSIENDDDCAIVAENVRPLQSLHHAHGSSMDRAGGFFVYTRPKLESPDVPASFSHLPHAHGREDTFTASVSTQPITRMTPNNAALGQSVQNLDSRNSQTPVLNVSTSGVAQRQTLRPQVDHAGTPLTPPFDVSRHGSSVGSKGRTQAATKKPTSSPARPSGTSSKFKQVSPHQSDIEDSQMSPRSKSSSRRPLSIQPNKMNGKQLFPSLKSDTTQNHLPEPVIGSAQVFSPLQERLGREVEYDSSKQGAGPEKEDVNIYEDDQIYVDRSAEEDSDEEETEKDASWSAAKGRQVGSDQLVTSNGNMEQAGRGSSTEEDQDIDSNQENKRPTKLNYHHLSSSQSDLRQNLAMKRPSAATSEETADQPRKRPPGIRRKRKSRIEEPDEEERDPVNENMTGESTPLDSPGEQLSQMQAEAQYAQNTLSGSAQKEIPMHGAVDPQGRSSQQNGASASELATPSKATKKSTKRPSFDAQIASDKRPQPEANRPQLSNKSDELAKPKPRRTSASVVGDGHSDHITSKDLHQTEKPPSNVSLQPFASQSPPNVEDKKQASRDQNGLTTKKAKQPAKAAGSSTSQSTITASREEHTIQVPSTFEESPVPATTAAHHVSHEDEHRKSSPLTTPKEGSGEPVIPKGMTREQYMKIRSIARNSPVETDKKPKRVRVVAEKKLKERSPKMAEEADSKRPAGKKSTTKELVAKKPIVIESAAEESAAESAARKSVTKEPVAKRPVAKKPVVKELAAKGPVVQKPVAEETSSDGTTEEESAAEEPRTRKSVAKEPSPKRPIAKQPVVRDPPAKGPIVKEPGDDETSSDEATSEESAAKEPVARKRPTKNPSTPGAVAEEPNTKKAITAKQPKSQKPEQCIACKKARHECELTSPTDTTCIRCATNQLPCSIKANQETRKAGPFEACDACRKGKVACRYPLSGSGRCVRCAEKNAVCENSLKRDGRRKDEATQDKPASNDATSVVSLLNASTKSAVKTPKTVNKAGEENSKYTTTTPSVVIQSQLVTASKTPSSHSRRPVSQVKTATSSTVQKTLAKPFTTPTVTPSFSSVKTMKDLKALQAAQDKEEEKLRSSQISGTSKGKPQFAVTFDSDSSEDTSDSDSDEPSLPKRILTSSSVLDRSMRDPTPVSDLDEED